MTDDTKYYFPDDATLIGDILKSEWSLPLKTCKKPVFSYLPDEDADSFDYTKGDIQCNITIPSAEAEAKGIGFDGYSETEFVALRIRARSDQLIMVASNEIKRILDEHAIYPGNNWQLLKYSSMERIFPGRKFSQRYIVYHLVAFWKPRTEP